MKKLTRLAVITALFTLLASGTAYAHYFWINAYESFAHGSGHVLMFLGFGHKLPADDLLSGDFGNISVQKLRIKGPDGKTTDLTVPDTARRERKTTPWGATLETGDIALTKFAAAAETPAGVYTVSAQSAPIYITKYLDADDKPKFAFKPMNEVKDAKKIMDSIQLLSFAKSHFTIGSEKPSPEAGGMPLEITPLTNLSNIRAGELVSFETTFMGSKVQSGADTEYITAFSDTFGMPDGYQLYSMILNGKSAIRFPAAGNWLVSAVVKKDVESMPELAELKGKVKSVYYSATLSFNVKP
ncbi:DUF4198 domain-containing protein [Geovibrio thiophilus]|uniref:DUF4198 domain-containing protein n=1 Tax=Geovibrio thiophilus TaxID=139438 RepID=A0A3R5XY24_9BACT|nr:DUF4198 domain-containing protein [Geovibrio thiophilus]QAR34040.1 DUF4198 domain-containing protein [Geovibrio thiophilus]